MPLPAKGRSILTKFMDEYGGKKGKSVFYAKANKSAKFRKAVGEPKK
jgi:hypothetical protein